jgi:blue copper oxidase
MLTRRAFAVGAGTIASASLLDGRYGRGELAHATARLPIPQAIDATRQNNTIRLTVSAGHHEFYKGKPTRTYGYSAPLLGPVLRLRRGARVEMSVHNLLDSATTIHWHGLLVPGDADGGPQRIIEPGAIWRPTFSIDQPAATLWYHPHPHHDTGRQTYLGLAGLIIIEDGDELGLPRHFGVDDLPLIIQDREFDDDGSLGYDPGQLGVVYGVRGDTIIVNGAITPTARVPAGWVRLRVLNGANARTFELRFQDRRTFHVIASDGGFLAHPVPLSELRISVGERFELLVDFANRQPVVLETGPDQALGIFGAISDSDTNPYVPVMRFETGPAPSSGRLPSRLVDPGAIDPSIAVQRRHFVLSNGMCGERTRMNEHPDMPSLTGINGQIHDPKRIDVETKLGTSEIWEIVSIGMPHPFHIHGAMFRIPSLNGEPPPDHLAGWKDVVLVEDKAELLVKFTKPATRAYPFMYHCHILEHEDAGMMGQYTCT